MSHKPIAAMSGLSLLGGISSFTRYSSVPSLVAGVSIGGAMALSSMRIRDGMDYGLEGATASSAALMIPTLRRAFMTRAPIPTSLAILATASTGYYIKEIMERHP